MTLRETLVGFALAIALSLPLAVLIALNATARKLLYPILLGLQSVPRSPWLPYHPVARPLRMAEDRDRHPRLLLSDPGQLIAGLEAAPRTMLDLMRSLGASQHMIFRRLRHSRGAPALLHRLQGSRDLRRHRFGHRRVRGGAGGARLFILISTSQSQTPLAFRRHRPADLLSIALFHGIEWIERRVVNWTP